MLAAALLVKQDWTTPWYLVITERVFLRHELVARSEGVTAETIDSWLREAQS